MDSPFFNTVDRIEYEGPDSDNPLAFRWYDADRVVAGRDDGASTCASPSCYWHSFDWDGSDIFGAGTLDRPWLEPAGDPIAMAARPKMEAAFEFFEKLGVPFLCFHDRRHRPGGRTRSTSRPPTSTRWSTSPPSTGAHRRRAAVGHGQRCSRTRASWPAPPPTPIPRCSPTRAAQVAHCMNATHRLGGAQLRAVGRPRGLRDAAQHRHEA